MVKIAGQSLERKLHEDVVVLPRGEDAIAVKARAIEDFTVFETLCPNPKPPGKLTKNGWEPNPEDPSYKKMCETQALKRIGWMVLMSLYEFEWDTVNEDNPSTWANWEDELKNDGFTSVERNLIMALVLDVNNLNEAKMKASRDSFILGQAQAREELSSLNTEQDDSQSGKPANG